MPHDEGMNAAGPSLPRAGTLAEFGGEVLEMANGVARVRYHIEPRFHNPRGTLQGGMYAVFLDDAMGCALLSLTGPSGRFATTDLVVHYLRPVSAGPVVAEAWVLRQGRGTAYLEGEVRDAGSRTCARASSTVVVLPAEDTATS